MTVMRERLRHTHGRKGMAMSTTFVRTKRYFQTKANEVWEFKSPVCNVLVSFATEKLRTACL